jgi:hypothetical protein
MYGSQLRRRLTTAVPADAESTAVGSAARAPDEPIMRGASPSGG